MVKIDFRRICPRGKIDELMSVGKDRQFKFCLRINVDGSKFCQSVKINGSRFLKRVKMCRPRLCPRIKIDVQKNLSKGKDW